MILTKEEIQEVRKSAQSLYEHATVIEGTMKDDFSLMNINRFLLYVEEEMEGLRGKVNDLYAEKEKLAYQQRGEWNDGTIEL